MWKTVAVEPSVGLFFRFNQQVEVLFLPDQAREVLCMNILLAVKGNQGTAGKHAESREGT